MKFEYFNFFIIFLGFLFIFGCAAQENPEEIYTGGFEEVPVEEYETPIDENLNESLDGNESLNGNETENVNGTAIINGTDILNGTENGINGTLNISGSQNNTGKMEIIFLDVGHGDATIIKTEKNTILIDSGADAQTISSKLMEYGISNIDLFVISSWDAQKTGGVRTVIRDFKVNEVWMSQDMPTSFQFESIREYIEKQETLVVNPKAGQTFNYGQIKLEVFNPQKEEFLNNAEANAIVLRASFGDFCVFLPSDLEQAVEPLVISGLDARTCAVYKWRNHGEARPLPSVLFDRISPNDVVISVGPNNDGYPSSTTIQRLGIARVGIFRTDFDSDIFVDANFDGTYIMESKEERAKNKQK